MALRTETQWVDYFKDLAIPEDTAAQYAASFTANRISNAVLPELNKETLKDLGVTIIGDVLTILQKVKSPTASNSAAHASAHGGLSTASNISLVKPPQYSCPQLQSQMTSSQFRRFKAEWEGYKSLVSIPAQGSSSHLYNLACKDDQTLKELIFNSNPTFSTLVELQINDFR